MEQSDVLWQAKLAAWTHDPAEKALVLLRDPAGHEGGTVRALHTALFGGAIPADLLKHVKRADHWASAADRPQFPKSETDGRYAAWTQVNFAEQPELIHPLSGDRYLLGKLAIDAQAGRALSTDHFQKLVVRDGERVDHCRTALAFWRFGPETPAADLNALWDLLPADTRVPDHTIWTHLDLSAALAGAFALDHAHNPALLTVSFGPVQDFIAQARTTSDLWAGSHLLSRIAWEGLKVVCERLGPDAVLFPQLRGVPQVDLWLRDDMKLPPQFFKDAQWLDNTTDANPLFAAALPNRFVAIVPADQAADLAARITETVRDWVQKTAQAMFGLLLEKTGITDHPALYGYQQIAEQLQSFPEVHWAAVPFAPLVTQAGAIPDTGALAAALAQFYPAAPGQQPGFLGSHSWALLSRDLTAAGVTFYRPNIGTLYPALYDLLDKVQAAAKSVRPFQQSKQRGYRCSLTGETEWLTTDPAELDLPPGERTATLWAKVAERHPAWARKGEHLGALAMLKRLWPSYFVRELNDLNLDVSRYVVSTHTMALATSLERWLDQPQRLPLSPALLNLLESKDIESVALPRKLARRLSTTWRHDTEANRVARRLPALLDYLRERESEEAASHQRIRQIEAIAAATRDIERIVGARPEAYYALIMLDGDSMGAWLSGTGQKGESYRLPYQATWHSRILAHLNNKPDFQSADLTAYLEEPRAVSPARHMAVSSALNAFALHLARHVVEDLCKGKLIYAGGDDVLAMVAVDDLLPALLLLRLAYAGVFPTGTADTERAWQLLGLQPDPRHELKLGNGHALFNGRLLRLMGHLATASAGAVVAHHQAPLGAVMRELRAAEKRAKSAGRDAFAISLLKRSGGAVRLAAPWLLEKSWETLTTGTLEQGPLGLLLRLRRAFSGKGFSRRAAYLTQGWSEHLPVRAAFAEQDETPTAAQERFTEMLTTNLGYQFDRQGGDKQLGATLGKLAVALTDPSKTDNPLEDPALALVRDMLAVAEFLARASRADREAD